jgi:hypothetical protein
MSRVDEIQGLMASRFGDVGAGYPVWPQKLLVGTFRLVSNSYTSLIHKIKPK